MFGRVDEVVKDTEGILRKFLKENNYQVYPENDDSQPKGQSRKDTSPLVVHVQTKFSLENPSIQIDLVEIANDTTDNEAVENSGEAM